MQHHTTHIIQHTLYNIHNTHYRQYLGLDESLDVGHDGEGHEHNEETGVQAVPQRRDEVGHRDRAAGAVVRVSLQPTLQRWWMGCM